MKQTRRMSLIEAIANVVVGFAVALLTQIIVFPLFGLRVSLGENLAIGGLFTLLCAAAHKSVYAESSIMRCRGCWFRYICLSSMSWA